MEFYTPPHGVVVTFDCRAELNYLRVKVFLQPRENAVVLGAGS
jgi:hypothetical protein